MKKTFRSLTKDIHLKLVEYCGRSKTSFWSEDVFFIVIILTLIDNG